MISIDQALASEQPSTQPFEKFGIRQMVEESLRIEGIMRPATVDEIQEHERFLWLDQLAVHEIERFVRVYQPNAELRRKLGQNVRIGSHQCPMGGPNIQLMLAEQLEMINAGLVTPWHAHMNYERLHPFTDGNGRSGRMIWYWMMKDSDAASANLGFLHAFYYQTLRFAKKEA